MNKDKHERTWYSCACFSADHALYTWYDPDEKENDASDFGITVHLKPYPFFKRLKVALKYMFGMRKWSCYDEFMLSLDEAKNLREDLDQYIKLPRPPAESKVRAPETKEEIGLLGQRGMFVSEDSPNF